MKITAFNGSPRAEKGNTHIMVEEFLNGARDAGAETEYILLAKYKISHCLGCFTCWIKTPGKCVHNDDMKDLLPKFHNTDIAVIATPLYVDNVTGIMKDFMDRLVPTLDARFDKDENGECRHINPVRSAESRGNEPRQRSISDTPDTSNGVNTSGKVPKLAVISNCGFPEQSHFQVLRLLFKRIARNMCSEVVAEIYRGGGALLEAKSLLLKPLIWKYKRLLRQAGQEVVKNGRLSEATRIELEKPLISDEEYIKGANKYWDKQL